MWVVGGGGGGGGGGVPGSFEGVTEGAGAGCGGEKLADICGALQRG